MKPILRTLLGCTLGLAVFTLNGGGCAGDSSSDRASSTGQSGKGGSTARFTLLGDKLYTLNGRGLIAYASSDLEQAPQRLDSIGVGDWWAQEPETIFPYGEYLLLGTPNGMQIFEQTERGARHIAQYSHMVSCDPVVAQDGYAYVTLRTQASNNRCNRGVNQLEVIDLTNISQPIMVAARPMRGPIGLGVEGRYLFVCDQDSLKQFDVTDPTRLLSVRGYDVQDRDCIVNGDHLMVVGQDGLTQLAIEPDGSLRQLSRLPITYTAQP